MKISIFKTLLYCPLIFISIYLLNTISLAWRQKMFSNPTTNKITQQILTPASPKEYLLVMFSCFKEGVEYPHHNFVHSYLINAWRKLSPQFHQVVFTTNLQSNMSMLALKSGWDVVQVNRSHLTGAPYFRDMYKYIFSNYKSVFYSFINGDILFDDSLILTLKAVNENLKKMNNNVLIIGQRLNYIFDEYSKPELLEKNNLKNLAKKGSLFWTCAEDYFIFTPPPDNTFAWDKIADVVVGRVAYDNYVVSMANVFKVNTVDATATLLAFHVSHPKIIQTGANNSDPNINKRIIGKFDYYTGLTTNSKYRTATEKGKFFLIRR